MPELSAARPARREVGERVRAWLRRHQPLLVLLAPVTALLALFVITEFRGVDFGFHWDEAAWRIRPVREMVAHRLWAPRVSIYPSFSTWLALLPALAAGLRALPVTGFDAHAIQTAMLAAIDSPAYLLTVRRLFIVVSALSIVWVYAAAWVLRKSLFEAIVAASSLALSWEFAYHCRFVATDCLVVQLSALTLLLLCCFIRYGDPRFLYAAAVASGLAIGTKFPAVPLLGPVLVCGAWAGPWRPLGPQLKRAALLGGVAFAAYLVTTPATAFDPFTFAKQLKFISAYYAQGHYGFTVQPGWEHWRKVLTYFAISYFSPYPAVSSLLLTCTVLGAVVWVRAERRLGLLLAGFPLAFLAFFCNRYATLIVRNYLLIGPFLALLLARGVTALHAWLPQRFLRAAFAGALAIVGAAQAAWLVNAGESIRHVDPKAQVRDALRYVAEQGRSHFMLSPRTRDLVREQHLPLLANVTDERSADHIVFFARAEGPDPRKWPANDPFAAERVFGPREVNFDWYPSWAGSDRVVVMSLEKARAIKVPVLSH